MSMNEDDHELDGGHDEHDGESDGHDDGGAEGDEPKKAGKGVIIAAVAGAVLVFGFAGMQVYKKIAKPSPGLDQSMMVEAPPAAAPAQALVPAGAQSDVSQPVPGQAPGAPPEMRMLSTSELGASAGQVAPTPVAAPVGGPPGSATAPLGGPAGQSGAAGALAGASGSIDMTALNSLKSQQEAQGKRIDSFDDRLSKMESRVSQLASGERGERVARVARAEPTPKREWQPKKAVVRKPLVKSLNSGAGDQKAAADSQTKADASQSVKLPPAPVEIAKSDVKAEPEKVVARINGLRIQAVIPGRAWVQDDGGATRSYALGDSIRPGVVIKSIDADKGVVETSVGAIR
jgi:hypothetical protein